MLKLSKKMLFALEAVVDIGVNARPDPVQSKEITQRQGIPKRYLEQVMQHLVRANILRGVRGPKGGYRLARERRRISVGEIVRVISEMELGPDEDRKNQPSNLGLTIVQPLWQELEDEMMERLDAINIEDLCRKAEQSGVAGEGRDKADFTI